MVKNTDWKETAKHWHQYAQILAKQLRYSKEYQKWSLDHIEKLTVYIEELKGIK